MKRTAQWKLLSASGVGELFDGGVDGAEGFEYQIFPSPDAAPEVGESEGGPHRSGGGVVDQIDGAVRRVIGFGVGKVGALCFAVHLPDRVVADSVVRFGVPERNGVSGLLEGLTVFRQLFENVSGIGRLIVAVKREDVDGVGSAFVEKGESVLLSGNRSEQAER